MGITLKNRQPAGDGTANQEGSTAAGCKPTGASRPRVKLLSSCLFFFGLASLSYVLGAAVIFFDLPTSAFLRRAFVGGATWYEQRHVAPPVDREQPQLSAGMIDKPGKTCDGFTLCMCGYNCRAVLINMRGQRLHQWHAAFSSIWPDPPHLRGRIDDHGVVFHDGHLYPNGDLLVVMEAEGDQRNAANGCGLAKLDKDSHVLWKYAANCHHYCDIGEDGTIYALSHAMVDKVPKGLDYIPTPCLLDFVDIVSADGKLLRRISLVEAFKDSPYAPLLCPLERRKPGGGTAPPGILPTNLMDDSWRRDVLHINAVKVLSRTLAPQFPLFKAGQLLISSRHLDAIAVLDPDSEKVVWAARGPWRAQHDPTFLGNGHLLLFDNFGSPRGSRVLEYDPGTQAFPWSYPGENGKPFRSQLRGLSQRLGNGNTLIVNSEFEEAFEVTADHEIVWSCSCGTELYSARRYSADQVAFLKGDARARP